MGDAMTDGFGKSLKTFTGTRCRIMSPPSAPSPGDTMPHRVPVLRRETMRGILLLLVILSFVAACGRAKRSPPPAPAVATVNGQSIDLKEFEKALGEETALAKREMPLKREETESLKEEVLQAFCFL